MSSVKANITPSDKAEQNSKTCQWKLKTPSKLDAVGCDPGEKSLYLFFIILKSLWIKYFLTFPLPCAAMHIWNETGKRT